MRTASSRSSSRRKVFDEFDKQESSGMTGFPSVLFHKDQPDSKYCIIRDSLLDKRSKSKINEAAIKIQSTFRMFRLRSKFKGWFGQVREMNRATKIPFYVMIVLNSFGKSEGRVALYESLRESGLLKQRYNEGYYMPSFQGFTITNQVIIPYYISEYMLVKFVKLCYGKLMRDILSEWHMIARRQKKIIELRERHRSDQMNKFVFKNYYVCFQLWYKWHLSKRPKRYQGSVSLPEWDHHLKVEEAKAMRIKKAIAMYQESVKVNALSALKLKVLQNRQKEASRRKADLFYIEKNGNMALRAWMKYIVNENHKATMKRIMYFKWLGYVNQKRHMKVMLDSFEGRHAMYLKHAGFGAFAKNKRIEQVLSTYAYLRIYQKPSLALFFISLLRNDTANEVIAHGFSAWLSFCRRRKRWQQFIYEDVNRSEYDMTKRRALAVLMNRRLPVPPMNTIDSKLFQRETVTIYQNAMQCPPTEMSLLITDDSRAAAYQSNEREITGRVQQRELFFKVWRNEVQETSILFRRCIVLSAFRLRKEQKTEKPPLEEIARKTFTKAVQYFASLNLANECAFSAVLRAIDENNRRAWYNRVFVTHRNRLILYAHESHRDASDLKKKMPSFTLKDTIKVDGMEVQYKALIPCDQLGDMMQMANESIFSTVIGCTKSLPSYSDEITTLHKKIHEELMRIELGHDSITRFDRLLAGKSDILGKGSGQVVMWTDPFRRVIRPVDKPGPITGLSDKLGRSFQSIGRRAKVIKNKATKGLNFGSRTEFKPQEDTFDEEELANNMASQRLSLTSKRSLDSQMFKVSSTLSQFLRRTSAALVAPPEEVIPEESGTPSEAESENANEEYEEEKHEKKVKIEEVKPKKEKIELNLGAVHAEFPADLKQTVGTHDMFDRAQRHRELLEMMFGRQIKDNQRVIALKNKLLYEMKHRKASFATTGIETRGLSRPVTAIAEKYRDDSMRENGVKRQTLAEKANKVARKRKKRDEDEYSCRYDSRKYKCAFAEQSGAGGEEEDFVDEDDLRMDLMESEANHVPKVPKTKKIRVRKHRNGTTSVTRSSASFAGVSSTGGHDGESSDTSGGHKNGSGSKSHHRHRNETSSSGGQNTNGTNDSKSSNKPSKSQISSPGALPKGKIIDDEYNYDYDYDDYDSSYSYEVVEVPVDEAEEMDTAEPNDNEFDPAARRGKRVRFAQFEFDRATPFATRTMDDGSTLSKVNKVVFHILEKHVEEEGPEGLLVEVDPDDIPGLSFGNDADGRYSHNWNKPKFYPIWKPKCTYNKRGPLFDPNKKPARPIVIENKQEIPSVVKEIVTEISPFSRLLYTNGRSTTHRKPVETTIFQPVYKTINPMKFNADSKSSIVEDGVVSFAGGGRSVGRNASNFMSVRVANSRQKKIGRPMTAMNNPAEARAMSVNAAVSQKQKADKMEHELHETMTLMISELADTVTDTEFEQFRRRSRAMRVKQNTNNDVTAADLVVKLKTVRSDLKSAKETPQMIATRVLSMFQNSREHNQVLIKTLDNKAKERSAKQKKRTTELDVTKIDPSIRINFVDTNWSGDIDYNAIAVQYNKHAKELDALIGPTVAPVKPKTTQPRARTSQAPREESGEFLEEFDMEEMMRILPYIITEHEIDAVLDASKNI